MQLARTLSRHQLLYLKEVCRGALVLKWVPEFETYAEMIYIDKDGEENFRVYPHSKPRGRKLAKCGNHLYSSIVELRQRGLLVDEEGRLVPSKQAAKEFGSPPLVPTPKRTFKMWRTRAARIQEAG